jgi:hypothetical protein
MPNELRIILDKSVVFGLSNSEIDSLDRYFFQIITPILEQEILADLTKEVKNPLITDKIANHSYRILGNRGLTLDFHNILANSLTGYFEVPMEGKFLPAGESLVRLEDGSFALKVETKFEDETVARWGDKYFTEEEKNWARVWRIKAERKINPKIYTDKISEAGLKFKVPKNDSELADSVNLLLSERTFQGKILALLFKEFSMPFDLQKAILNRWFRESKPMIKDFAPYAFFCARANFLWAIGLTNIELFKSDKNDRKDLEYCYYLPHCEIFVSKDNKHKRLVPFLLRPDQSFVDSEQLKIDLRNLSEFWEELSNEEKINYQNERGYTPPENEDSVIFNLWQKHRGDISKPIPLEILDMEIVDSRLPKEEQIPITFREWIQLQTKKVENAENLTHKNLSELKESNYDLNSTPILKSSTLIRKDRLLKMFPNLKPSDLDEKS